MKNKGFTLVELLVTICILGLIAAIVIPVSTNILTNIKEEKFISDSKTILKNVEIYMTENNYKIPDDGILINEIDLEIDNLSNYTGKIKFDGSDVYFESIYDNNFCGKGTKENFEVYEDLSKCFIS